jgi:DNA repair exonuclease SbcCD ATPase subunit
MLLFERLRYKNLLSTGNYWSEIELNAHQTTLIVGTNGSGKSTILDALCFVMFGQPFRKINKPNLVNSINNKDCLVECEFTIDGSRYKVRRGIKPNIFEIFKDGDLVNQNAESRDYQEYLEKYILKFNFKSFTQIVILGSASFTPFMQLSAQDRRAVIEDLLDIQIFSTMNQVVKERLSGNKEEISRTKLSLENGKEKVVMHTSYLAAMMTNHDEQIQQYQQEYTKNTEEIKKLEASIHHTNTIIDTLTPATTEKPLIDKRIKELHHLESQLDNTIAKDAKHIQFLQKHDSCPMCSQSLEETFKQQQQTELTSKIQTCQEAMNSLKTKLSLQIEKLSAVSNVVFMIHEHHNKSFGWNTSMTEILRFNSELQKKIQVLQRATPLTGKEQEKLQALQHEVASLKLQWESLVEEKSYYDAAAILLKDTGIKTKIIKQYLPIINTLVNKYLAAMDFFVNFTINEAFEETIRSRHRDTFSYASFSEGEKQRIDMALLLTWRAIAKLKNSANTNLLILDEIFDSSLDGAGVDELSKIINNLESTNVFIISHRVDILSDKYKHIIHLKKVSGFSHATT